MIRRTAPRQEGGSSSHAAPLEGRPAAGRRALAPANIALGIVVALILACAIAALALTRPAESGAALVALVHDGDGGTRELPLSQNAEIAVTTSLGTNVVVVQDGSVCVRDADCEGLDCVRQGAISTPGRQIVCLPHKLWIEIVAAGEEGGELNVDAVAGEGAYDALAR